MFGRLTPVVSRWTWLRHVPRVRRPAPRVSWPDVGGWETPEVLRSVPGVLRDPEAVEQASGERPLYEFFKLHPETQVLLPRYGWAWQLPSMPRRIRMRLGWTEVSEPERQPKGPAPRVDAGRMTAEIRTEAERLGLSQVGFAPFDSTYSYQGGAGLFAHAPMTEENVVVCLLEQDWKVTQTIPSTGAERAVMRTYSDLVARAGELTEFLHRRGFEAQMHGPGGPVVSIHYAVEAGLGQLGLNGQLLTPRAGSRCRITLITTNAPVVYGKPVDFGIPKICDECQLCVKRCPPGAIPNKRAYHRGVLKTKIKPERCLPVLAHAHGCAVCMKVCPVQRYGLAEVTKHYLETGAILGKGTDELEGYHWVDGRYYGPGQKPRINKELLTPMGIDIDPHRQHPPSGATDEDTRATDLSVA